MAQKSEPLYIEEKERDISIFIRSDLVKKALKTELTREMRRELSSKGTELLEEIDPEMFWKIPYVFHEKGLRDTLLVDIARIGISSTSGTIGVYRKTEDFEEEYIQYDSQGLYAGRFNQKEGLVKLMKFWVSFIEDL